MGLWVYRAYDKDGLPVCEAYTKPDLIDKLLEEYMYSSAYGDTPQEVLSKVSIKREFQKWLK